MQSTRQKQEGFTVLEIIIVLAIAGLILSIVLLAVPTLQRNGRNNQRSQDASTLLSEISRYQLNHSGNFPDTAAFQTIVDNAKLTYYTDAGQASIFAHGSGSTAPSNDLDTDTIQIHNRSKCRANNPTQPTGTGAGYSDIVALYSIETRNSTSPKCQQLR